MKTAVSKPGWRLYNLGYWRDAPMPKTALFCLTVLFCLILSACQTAQLPSALPDLATLTATARPTFTRAPDATLNITATPREPRKELTATISPTGTRTPLPTIPTFTPTFDVRTIVTATPAPKAECPEENPSVKMDFKFPHKFDDLVGDFNQIEKVNDILAFLNQGGKMSLVVDELSRGLPTTFKYKDVTQDGVSDLLMEAYGVGYHNFYIFACVGGQYKLFRANEGEGAFRFMNIPEIKDLNRDGIPEIVVEYIDCCSDFSILEWNGNTFKNIAYDETNNDFPNMVNLEKYEIKDTNKDGLDELVLTGNIMSEWYYLDYYPRAPWRSEIHTFFWNGKIYSRGSIEYSTPQYRFQAVQDGDRAILIGNYEKAIAFYDDAIFGSKLEWFSPERKKYIETLGGVYGKDITPEPLIPDPTEYPRLAAYAYYRMVSLHTFLGQMDAAQVKYATLQEKFPAGSPGHPYAEMTTAFWDAYQSSGKMYNACAAAIAYAAAHPEILTPLGSAYHGAQSRAGPETRPYVPADVCPFR
jgi:hypothetical protein